MHIYIGVIHSCGLFSFLSCTKEYMTILKLYTGMFGNIYKAQMRDVIVAIKVTKKFLSEKAMSDFKNEMSIMSEVCHNNVVRLYGIISEGVCHALPTLSLSQETRINFTGDLSPALVMEYSPNGDLKKFLIVKLYYLHNNYYW